MEKTSIFESFYTARFKAEYRIMENRIKRLILLRANFAHYSNILKLSFKSSLCQENCVFKAETQIKNIINSTLKKLSTWLDFWIFLKFLLKKEDKKRGEEVNNFKVMGGK